MWFNSDNFFIVTKGRKVIFGEKLRLKNKKFSEAKTWKSDSFLINFTVTNN